MFARLMLESRFEDGGYKHYLTEQWAEQIAVSQALISISSSISRVDEDMIHFSFANGAATYRKIKADDLYWYGELQPGWTFRPMPPS